MLVFLQTLLMLRAALMDWLFWRLGGVVSPAEKDPEEEDQATAEYDDERGVVFYPPVYAQRYAAVSDLLQDPRWVGRLKKVVDLGYHDTSFIKYLKEVPGVRTILGVDLDIAPVAHNLFRCEDYATKREDPLTLVLFQGNAADPDYRLIGCDAVVSIEMVEHMLPHDLERLVHTVFGFIKPLVAIFTTPNADFNVLFKSMLANGFRNWDHKFEWTREQFNEWCANIVCRYPQYEVYSHGVGPGPPDTAHLGCCTQLALFVNNDYQKRCDLTPDTLSLITKYRQPHRSTREGTGEAEPTHVSSCDLPLSSTAVLEIPKSLHTVFVPDSTVTSTENQKKLSIDKPAQCNIEVERAKEYLMKCDDESGLKTLGADRYVRPKVYNIEDVSCRLNCSTVQVKRFSEKSSMLMADMKPDLHLRTEEVIGELKHLTKMLNLSRRTHVTEHGETVWNNINWGENAPYWNQYYTIVKEYEYPFEIKSKNERILDLLSDEIHRIADQAEEEEWRSEGGRLRIELERLMPVVRHMSDDVDAVRDLLDWNGHEIQNECIVYTRPAFDENPKTDAWSDAHAHEADVEWDFDETQSTVYEDPVSPDCSEYEYADDCVRREIDRKLQSLRSVLDNDRDITSELSTVIDKLSTLALRNNETDSHGKRQRWMQHKLHDLLSLSEKAFQKRGNPSVAELASGALEEYHDPLLNIKISLSSICTHKTFQNEVLPSYDQDLWQSEGSVELSDSEETLHNGATSLYDMFTDSTVRPDISNSPDSMPNSPVRSHKKLDRNIHRKGGKRIVSPMRFSKKGKNDAVKVNCCRINVERMRKGHKRKFRKFSRALKLEQQASAHLETYEPMIKLCEKEEDIASELSKEIEVLDLCNEETELRSNCVKPDVYSSFFVADNKIYQCDMRRSSEFKSIDDDYCEPSTSTGIRHTAAYIQCDKTQLLPYNTVSTSIDQYSAENICTCATPSAQTQSSSVAVGTQLSVDKEVGGSATDIAENRGSNLRCCGINLHCYKERRKNDGVIYHGQWQKQAKENNIQSHESVAVDNGKRIKSGRLFQVADAKKRMAQENGEFKTKPKTSDTRNVIRPRILSNRNSSLSRSPRRDVNASIPSKVTSPNKNPIKNSTNENSSKYKVIKTKMNASKQSYSSVQFVSPSRSSSTRNSPAGRNITPLTKKYSKEIPKNFSANKIKRSSDEMRTKKINSNLKNVKDIPSKIAVQKLPNGFTLVVKKDVTEAGCSTKTFSNEKSEADKSMKSLEENKICTQVAVESEPNANKTKNIDNTKRESNADVITFGRNDLVVNQNPLVQCSTGFSIEDNSCIGNSEIPVASVSFGDNVNSELQIASREMTISNHTSDVMPVAEAGVLPGWLSDLLNNQPSEPDGGTAEAVDAAGVGREVAGAGDGRGVHLSSSTSDYSSSILSTDGSLSNDVFQLMNVDRVARTDSAAIEDLPVLSSSSSSTTTADTRVRVVGRTRARAAPPERNSLSGVDGDVSSIDMEVNE